MKESKQKLMSAMEELLRSKDLDDIRVTELIQLANLSRKTFYREYKDKYDLAANYFYEFYQKNLLWGSSENSWEDDVVSYLTVCEEKAEILRHGYSSQDVNGLKSIDLEYTREAFLRFLKKQNVDTTTNEMKFAIEMATYGGTEMNIQWLLNGMKITKREQARLIKRTLPSDIKKYVE